jgi:hypothetical protein
MAFSSLYCLGSAGYTSGESIRTAGVHTAATIRQVAAAAIAVDNANQLVKNYKDQRDISKRALHLAQQQQQQLRTVYWPREQQFLAEFANPEAIETVDAMGRRYAGRLVATVAAAFARQIKEAKCSFARYCTSQSKKIMQDLLMARATGIANARVLGRNIAFAEFQARNDVNFERRAQAVAVGRGLMQQAATLYASAGQGLAAVSGIYAGQLNSALEAFGYARRDYRNASGSAEANTIAQGQYEYFSRQRAGTTMPSVGSQTPQGVNGVATFGYDSSNQSFMHPDASNTFGVLKSDQFDGDEWMPTSNWGQAEAQMNEGEVGIDDLARGGIVPFEVIGITGGVVLVDMSRFPLMNVDYYNNGDYTPPLIG